MNLLFIRSENFVKVQRVKILLRLGIYIDGTETLIGHIEKRFQNLLKVSR